MSVLLCFIFIFLIFFITILYSAKRVLRVFTGKKRASRKRQSDIINDDSTRLHIIIGRLSYNFVS